MKKLPSRRRDTAVTARITDPVLIWLLITT
jgi:hypothetical protein